MKHLLCVCSLLILASSVEAKEPTGRTVVLLTKTKPVLLRLNIEVDGKPIVEVWEKFAKALFDGADADKNGVLDEKESKRLPPPQAVLGSVGRQTLNVGNLDGNGDKKVTPTELKSYLMAHGAGAFHLSGSAPTSPNMYLAVSGRSNSTMDFTARLFELLDSNKDNKLSRAELEKASELLIRRDADDDEIISDGELRPNYQPSGSGGTQLLFVNSMGMVGGSGTSALLVDVPNGKESVAVSKRLFAAYRGAKNRQPQGTIDRATLGLDPESFAELDKDKDGKLTEKELSRFGLRRPDLEITLRVGKRGGRKAIEVTGYRGREVPADSPLAKITDKLVMRVGKTNRMTLALDDGRGGQEFRIARPARIYEQQFQAADRDNNDYLDKTESRRIPLFSTLFGAMDSDSDGQLFLKEVKAYMGKLESIQALAKKSTVTLSANRQGKGLFDLMDTNHDSRLSIREMRNAPALLKEYDLDKDEALSKHEVPVSYNVSLRQGASGGGGLGGVIAVRLASTGRTPAPKKPGKGPLWFRKMDRNGDGDVSKREFLGPLETFSKLDQDGDGLIGLDEAEQADKTYRKK